MTLVRIFLDNPYSHQRARLSGFSLVGTLCALLISSFLITSFLQTVMASRANNKLVAALAQTQGASRLATSTMEAALTYRGFEGCRHTGALNILDFGDAVTLPPTKILDTPNTEFPITDLKTQSLRAYSVTAEGAYQPEPDVLLKRAFNNLSPAPVHGSDVLVVYNNSSQQTPLAQAITSPGGPVRLKDDTLNIVKNDYLYIGNCFKGAISKVADRTDAGDSIDLTPSTETLPSFNTDAMVHRANLDIYYIANTGRKDFSDKPIRALYRYRNGQNQEIAQGLALMKVEFGEKLSTGLLRYRKAEKSTTEENNIEAIKVGFLATSTHLARQQDDATNYQVLSTVITPSIHKGFAHPRSYKTVFSFNISLING